MKRRATVVIVNGNDRYMIYRKIEILIVLLIIFIMSLYAFLHQIKINDSFSDAADTFMAMNQDTAFSIDKVYLYSSAYATNSLDNRSIWNLSVNQYTDIALYINNRYANGLNYYNSIKSLTISDISFNKANYGKPSLYYKDIQNFATSNFNEDYKIDKNLDFSIENDSIDTSVPSIYSNAQNPITLGYVNSALKENYVIEDDSSTITYDGNLLRMTEVSLSSMKCTISFKITLTNYYNNVFVANVYIDIPLEDDNGDTIYQGKLEKTIENTNLFKFFRIK